MLCDDVLSGFQTLFTLNKSIRPFYTNTLPLLVDGIERATRFNLTDNVVRATANLVATKATKIEAYLEFARRPARLLWIEFPVKPRSDFLSDLGIFPTGNQPARVGMLIEDHPAFPNDLLCGRALVAWRHVGTKLGEIGYFELQWNFRDDWCDWRTPSEREKHRKLTTRPTSVAWLYKSSQAEIDAYCRLNSRFHIAPAWVHGNYMLDFFIGKSEEFVNNFIVGSQSDATSEAIMILSILMLFNIQKALDFVPVSYDVLNKGRVKRNKKPLLSHNNVNFYITKAKRRSYHARGMSLAQGVVFQRVIGYPRSRLQKDGSRKLFWVEPYDRGDPKIGLGPSITHNKTVRL